MKECIQYTTKQVKITTIKYWSQLSQINPTAWRWSCMKNQIICSLYNWIQRIKMLDSDDLRKGMWWLWVQSSEGSYIEGSYGDWERGKSECPYNTCIKWVLHKMNVWPATVSFQLVQSIWFSLHLFCNDITKLLKFIWPDLEITPFV